MFKESQAFYRVASQVARRYVSGERISLQATSEYEYASQ